MCILFIFQLCIHNNVIFLDYMNNQNLIIINRLGFFAAEKRPSQ